jgi:hypothetical protein
VTGHDPGRRPWVAASPRTLWPMRTTRLLVERLVVDGQEVDTSYADVFVVVREGADAPGPTDWEVTARSDDGVHLEPGQHVLQLEVVDGTSLSGRAIIRFSDGRRLLFRGDGHLAGFSG